MNIPGLAILFGKDLFV